MYILYVDASGNPEQSDRNSKHFVLLGLCVHEGTWFALNKRFQGMKSRFCPPLADFELHAKDFAMDFPEQREVLDFEQLPWMIRRARVQEVRDRKLSLMAGPKAGLLRKKYQRTQPFIHLTRAERSRLLEDSLDLVGGHQGIRLFAEAIGKSHPLVVAASVDCVHQAFEQVVARFDSHLQRQYQWKARTESRPRLENGLMILDQDYAHESAIDRQFKNFRKTGHTWGELRHVIDVPFFAASEKLAGIQLADVCAYAVRRYLDSAAVVGSPEEQNFLRIFGRFDRDAAGRLHGLRHYTPAGRCSCLICQHRGHSPS